jgi:hypothetical protein
MGTMSDHGRSPNTTPSDDGQDYSADAIVVDSSVFVGNLGVLDDNVQKALVTIDAMVGGETGVGIPIGINTGDFIRWNAIMENWEVAEEPEHFKGLVLTPALASLIDAEGAIYYNSLNKGVMVCTST